VGEEKRRERTEKGRGELSKGTRREIALLPRYIDK